EAVRVLDQLADQVPLAERLEDDPGVADEAAERLLPPVEDVQQRRALTGDAGEVRERRAEILPAAVGDRRGQLGLPAAERLPRLRVERLEQLVELDRRADARLGEAAAVGDLLAAAPAGRQLDVGLAE